MGREERKKAEEAFKQDVTVQVLIATDASGEGISLQRAHLMADRSLPSLEPSSRENPRGGCVSLAAQEAGD
jgi:superfamily II DNA/RNA helicase